MNFPTKILFFLSFILVLTPSLAFAQLEKKKNFKNFRKTSLGSPFVAVIDASTGELLFGKNENEKKPVASITKIVGAYVYLEGKPNLKRKVKMETGDEVGGGRLKLPVGTSAKAKDFLYSSLIGSANNSATALIRLSGLSKSNFTRKMEELAGKAGASSASFVDSSGISPNNQASAKDLALIGKKVLENKTICNIGGKKKYSFKINSGRGTKNIIHTSSIVNTRNKNFDVLFAKTGYLPEIGNNLIVKLESKQKRKNDIIIVAMGAKTKTANASDVTKLGNWVMQNYK
jgi:D-alanyl-D-alanine endopeptidase (penicillin-binding protein 7)